ncbi:MAG: helix-turn-helix domain-containing protein [Candidatus Staskawiczbacteria bacterium]|nr:helix-turn-helix domain-containing protein [Candidatus Staskawiczbacteria bacterium]
MSDFSQKIKELRENLKISLEDLAAKTKIPQRYLNWLETDDFDKLPAPVYMIGVLQVYARFFKLDSEELIKDYYEAIGKSAITSKISTPDKKSFNLNPGFLRLVVIVMAFSLVLAYFIYQITSLNFKPTILLTPVADRTTSSETLIFKGQLKPIDSKLTINNQDIWVSESGEFNKELFLNPGSNIFVISAISRYGQRTELIRKILRQ